MSGIKMFLRKNRLVMLIASILLSFHSCKEDSKINSQISSIPIDLKISRFDVMLKDASTDELPRLKQAFPFLFDSNIPDSVWIQKFNDPIQKELIAEVNNKYRDIDPLTEELKDFYQHLSFYVPKYQTPEIITLTNDVDYRNKIIVTDTLTLIALDNYLGEDHRFYQNISRFVAANMNSEQIVVDLAEEYASREVKQKPPRTFLDEMVYQGKLLYFKDVMLPFKSDNSKIGYTKEELQWAEENEADIWTYFIEKEVLFSTDPKLNSRFINPAPYSKFYLELDNESPGRIGSYMGWQIVRAYADNSEEELSVIMSKSADELFRESKFKPRK